MKVDTGLGRNGAVRDRWDDVAEQIATFEAAGRVRLVGAFSHLAVADDLSRAAETDAQRAAFMDAVAAVERAGLNPGAQHIANTAAAMTRPDLHLDMVRVGIGIYGLSPFAEGDIPGFTLRPAMALRTVLAHVKSVPPGHGVSYGYDFLTAKAATLGLVPMGYADGIPRSSVGAAVVIGGHRYPVVGRVAMDQFVVDLSSALGRSETRPAVGDVVEVFAGGGVTADEWASTAGTINYEIVTRISSRVERHYVG